MNPVPKFLTFDQVIALHLMQIDEFGGSPGVKDEGLLASALAQAELGFDDKYFHKDLYEMAAAQSLKNKEQIADFFRENTKPD